MFFKGNYLSSGLPRYTPGQAEITRSWKTYQRRSKPWSRHESLFSLTS